MTHSGVSYHAQLTAAAQGRGLVSPARAPMFWTGRWSLGGPGCAVRRVPSPTLRPGPPAGPYFRANDRQNSADLNTLCFDRVRGLRHDRAKQPSKKERAECVNPYLSLAALRPWPCLAVSTPRPNAGLPVPQRALSLQAAPAETRLSARLSAAPLGPYLAACPACRAATKSFARRLTRAVTVLNAIRASRPGGVFRFAADHSRGAAGPAAVRKEAPCSRKS